MEEVEGKRKKRTRQRAKAGAGLGSEAALAEEDQDDGDDDDDDADSASLPPPSPTKRKKRAATADKSTPAAKGRRKPTKKSSAKPRRTESVDEVIQLGESFDFSSDLGPEDADDDDVVGRTRPREDLDVDFSDGDEATDDEPGDEERSFARLEAAQDALDFARDELLRDDLEAGDDDDMRADLVEDDDNDYDLDIIPASLLAKTISSRAPAQTVTSKRGAPSRGIAKLSGSFASTKPARSRTGGAKKRSTSTSLPADDSDGLSPLAVPTSKSGKTATKRTAATSSGGGSKARSKKAPPAYIEISD